MNTFLRSQIFKVLKKISDTPDAKFIANKTLSGLLASPSRFLLGNGNEYAPPYADLGGWCTEVPTAQRSDLVFITGRFRSGSTLLWNLFRQMEQCTAYYEPFNERRWFDPSARGSGMDSTHRGVSNYWKEYDGLAELSQYFSDDWPFKDLFMSAQFWNPEMKRFIEIMAERANGRPVLQFNRLDFRLPWVRHYFPHAKIIHLYRHPRAEWFSCLFHERCQQKDCSLQEFFQHEGFYLHAWSEDLRYQFPFLDAKYIEHPYDLFYLIWKLSYLFGMQFAHYSVSYEELTESPRRVLSELFNVLSVEHYDLDALASLIDPRQSGRWSQYASAEWFQERESRCEVVLAEFFGQDCHQPAPVNV